MEVCVVISPKVIGVQENIDTLKFCDVSFHSTVLIFYSTKYNCY